MAIVLRKVGGKLTALLARTGVARFASSGPSTSVDSVLRSPMLLVVLLIATAVAWILAHGGFHASPLMAFGFAGIVESNYVVEKRKEYGAKAKKFADVTAQVATSDDLTKKEVLEALGATDAKSAQEKLLSMGAELEAMGRDIDNLNIQEMKRQSDDRMTALSKPVDSRIPAGGSSRESKSFGRLVVDSKNW